MSEFFLRTVVLFAVYISWIFGLPNPEVPDNENCASIRCSNIEDPVCGFLHTRFSDFKVRSQFLNLCHLNRYLCQEKNEFWIPAGCDSGRRLADFGINGAPSVFCNHSCPTSCPDFYDPVCMLHDKKYIPIVNHCKVDMYSCNSGNNVSLTPFYNCYKLRPWVPFALTAKVMKNLKLLKPKKLAEGLEAFNPKEEIYSKTPMMIHRRSFLWMPEDGGGDGQAQVEGGQDLFSGPQSAGQEVIRAPRGGSKEVLQFTF